MDVITQVFQDISSEHRGKTCTVERHPHEHKSVLSIHPCQHSNVMKSMISMMNEEKLEEAIRVDQYLMIFLKFMQTVLPTMEYDFL
jgi:ubiquitin-like-conjugating enzyme ATG3